MHNSQTDYFLAPFLLFDQSFADPGVSDYIALLSWFFWGDGGKVPEELPVSASKLRPV
jgi:hypothetical protein